jgi:8-oxo-dGTP diphosphatase
MESFEACATREVKEETNLDIVNVRLGTTVNAVSKDHGYHYVVVVMVADVADPEAEPQNMEPEKCEGWSWHSWSSLPTPTYISVVAAKQQADFDPFAAAGAAKELT